MADVTTTIKGRCSASVYDPRLGIAKETRCTAEFTGPDHETNLLEAQGQGWSIAFDGCGVMWAHCPTCANASRTKVHVQPLFIEGD